MHYKYIACIALICIKLQLSGEQSPHHNHHLHCHQPHHCRLHCHHLHLRFHQEQRNVLFPSVPSLALWTQVVQFTSAVALLMPWNTRGGRLSSSVRAQTGISNSTVLLFFLFICIRATGGEGSDPLSAARMQPTGVAIQELLWQITCRHRHAKWTSP